MTSQDGDAALDLTLPGRPNYWAEATDVLHPDASFPPFVVLDGSGVVGYDGYAHEGDENPPLEQLLAGPEKEVYKEQTMHPSDDDGLAASNIEYAEDDIPQSVRKTLPVVDIFAKDQAPRQQKPQDPSIGFTQPPHVPESFPRDPVPQGGKGEGWPYAPQGWPKPDDKWGWRVGQRAAANSLWIDRYVTLPVSLMKGKKLNISDEQFASKKSLVEYLRQTFPQMKDPNSILKAFDWKVPAPKYAEAPEKRGLTVKRDKTSPVDGDDNWQKSKKQCRADNPHCPLTKGKFNESESLERLVCNICCTEPNFCRECKCILCCKFFAPDADDFCIIRCLSTPLLGPNSLPSEKGICGHAAHLECALNSQLAGVIKKNRLDLEYICRRCDRKTNLKETLSRLVSEFMTAKESKVESSLQLLLRVVEDPWDEAGSSGKIREILLGAFKKVHEGADIVASCKELTEQLLEDKVSMMIKCYIKYPTERSQARRRKRTFEDSQHSYEAHVDKQGPRSKSVDSPDAQATFSTFMFHENNKSTSAINTRQGYSNDTSPAVHRIDSIILSKEVCEGNGATATSGTRVEPGLNMDKQLSRTLLQNSLKLEDISLSIPTDLLSCTPFLSSLLDQSVCKPPTLSIEEHIRQCQAMTDRVKGAGTLGVILNSDSKPPPSLTDIASSLTVVNPVAEAAADTGPPSAEKLVPSSSRAKSPSLFNSQDADKDHTENTAQIVEVRKSSRLRPVTRSSSRQAKIPTSQDVGGDHIASAKIINSSRKKQVQDAGGDDVVITQIVEVPKNIEPLQMIELPAFPTFDPSMETTHGAGLESEFDDQISEALKKLRRAQAAEYARAEESLNAQKNIVIEQYRQLDKACGRFAKKKRAQKLNPHKLKKDQREKSRAEFDHAMNRVVALYEKAQEGLKAFESMLAISNGFGQASQEFLRDFFKWSPSHMTDSA